ncbi:MAG: ATP-binding protein [Tannerella sp.]|jgi:anti-sigma regulatory factor (Ser/Thr protein kinase)|nr:ATP-binding protein [Tannerella sp.]
MVKEIHIINDIHQLLRVNEELIRLAEQSELSGKMCMNLKLALEEALTNVILYAYPDEENKDITIQFEITADLFKIIITDTGLPFDPTQQKRPDLTLPIHKRPVGGLGIHLIREIMTDVHYIRNGNKNVLTMQKSIH